LLLASSCALANPASDTLHRMQEGDRRNVLAQLVHSSGEACGAGAKTFFQGTSRQNHAFWNLRCSNGRAYQIMFYPDRDGSSKLLDCSVLRKMNAGECFKKF
jgi:hypothetical protein